MCHAYFLNISDSPYLFFICETKSVRVIVENQVFILPPLHRSTTMGDFLFHFRTVVEPIIIDHPTGKPQLSSSFKTLIIYVDPRPYRFYRIKIIHFLKWQSIRLFIQVILVLLDKFFELKPQQLALHPGRPAQDFAAERASSPRNDRHCACRGPWT